MKKSATKKALVKAPKVKKTGKKMSFGMKGKK